VFLGNDRVYFCSYIVDFNSVRRNCYRLYFFLRGLVVLVKLCSKELEYLAKRLGTGEHSVFLGSVRVPLCA
jgi:hypothetical protein